MTSRIIDAHVHLWDLTVRPQPWADPFPVLHRSFLVDDLRAVLSENGVDAALVVQAGDTYEETLDLLAIAAEHPVVAGVVGWVDLATSDVEAQLAGLLAAPGGDRLVGMRHQLQYEADRSWIARDAVRCGLAVLADHGLCFDLVITADQLPVVIDAAAALPAVRFVLDHAGKPPIATGQLAAWHQDIARLAALPNAACKLSGLVTEADHASCGQADLDPVIDRVLDCFGPERVMAGSDWPVCLVAADYPSVRATLTAALTALSPKAREDVLGGTAQRWYLGGSR